MKNINKKVFIILVLLIILLIICCASLSFSRRYYKVIAEQRLNEINGLHSTIYSRSKEISEYQNIIDRYKHQTVSTNNNEDTSEIVYVTDTGHSYHKNNCSYLSKSQRTITKSEAIQEGYLACSKCNP